MSIKNTFLLKTGSSSEQSSITKEKNDGSNQNVDYSIDIATSAERGGRSEAWKELFHSRARQMDYLGNLGLKLDSGDL